jgi:pimeloyl-ACP methyl ester carboxylesterase
MARIEFEGGSVEYIEKGSGPPVVLLHSTGASSAQWRALVERLSARFHVLAPDLYGYGATTGWRGRGVFALAHEAALVGALFERLGEPVHLVGHSYGGAVALHICRTRGELLRSLTLYEPVAFHLLRDGDENDEAALREITQVASFVGGALASGDYAAGAEHFVDYWSGPGAWAAVPADKQDALAARLGKVALDFQATIHEAASLGDFEHIALPTLLMRGDGSPAPTQRICRHLARVLPHASFKTVPGAGHMGPLTHRDEVNDLVVDHLNRVLALA